LRPVFFDGKDDLGIPLASGLYFVVVTQPDRQEIKKVLVLRQ
jgi:hypothetical protein